MTTYGSILTNLREITMQLLRQRDKEAYYREKWEQYKSDYPKRGKWKLIKHFPLDSIR